MFLRRPRRLRGTSLLLIAIFAISIVAGCDNSTSHVSTTVTPTPTAIKPGSYIAANALHQPFA